MERRRPPGTEEGWYVLHDLRRIDWDAWREAPDRRRDRAIEEGTDYLQSHVALEDAEEGGSAVFTVVGHKADLLVLHLRPTLEHLDRAQRRFESTALAAFTERASSYVSVTEVSGYMHEDLTDGLEDVEDEGMRNYMRQRIYPDIPEADHVCFYPMDKRRDPEYNWYDLPFEERAEYMSAHGDIGREYAGQVTQIITGSVGLDDHEWGVTLFADDPADIKHLLYEMRFDPSTSRFAEFGTFYLGRRFPPEDLRAVFEGEAVPTDEPLAGAALDAGAGDEGHLPTESDRGPSRDARDNGDADSHPSAGGGGRPSPGDAVHREIDADAFVERAARYGVDLGDAGYGLVFESHADPAELESEVADLRESFEHYDTHVRTVVGADGGDAAVVSLWTTERAADTASGFLADLPGSGGGVGAPLDAPEGEDGAADAGDQGGGGRPDADPKHEEIDPREFQQRVRRFGVRLDEHPEAGYALLFHSETAAEDLVDEVEGLRENFEHYDTHVLTTVRADAGDTAVVSLWTSERAADTASGFLADLSGAGPGLGASLDGGDEEAATRGTDEDDDIRGELEDLDVYAGQPHGEDVYAMVLYSEADPGDLKSELAALEERFEEYDSHVKSAVYADAHASRGDAGFSSGEGERGATEGTASDRRTGSDSETRPEGASRDATRESGEPRDGERSAVVSIWETEEAADTAGGFLSELPGVVERAGESGNFGTMGMFYTVQPDHREEFVETFAEVGDLLADTEGHLDTRLMVNVDDENDMFIASQWLEREDAMAFFRSDAFRETVEWGREVLADRPRHVFLA